MQTMCQKRTSRHALVILFRPPPFLSRDPWFPTQAGVEEERANSTLSLWFGGTACDISLESKGFRSAF